MPQPRTALAPRLLIGIIFALVLAGSACRKETPPSGPGGPDSTAGGQEADPAVEPGPVGVDDQDDPDAPRALPRTDDIMDCVKTRAVRVSAPGELDALVADPARLAVMQRFEIRRAARCGYQFDGIQVDVLLVHARTSVDAFGLFSVLTPSPGKLMPADGSVRAVEESADARTLSGCQGDVYLCVRCRQVEDAESARRCDQLFNKIIFDVMPGSPPPFFLRAVPARLRAGSHFWLVRSTAALALVENPTLAQIDPAIMDRRLGLTGEETLSIASVPVDQDEPDNVVWLAEYAIPESAAAAHQRYDQAIQAGATELDRNTLIDAPRGRFLAGSWTAGQESIQHLLRELRQGLLE